jgi:hypothetical protein
MRIEEGQAVGPAYPAARVAAEKVHPHFARDLAAAQQRAEDGLAPAPDLETMEALIDAAFWASLRREEGLSPRISLAFLAPERAGSSLIFERPMPLAAETLAPLAPAVERPGIHLGVWRERGQLSVWGATRQIPALCFVIEVVAPGLLVIKHRRGEETAKFVNVAVLEGDRVKLVDQQAASLPGCPSVVAEMLGFDSPGSGADSTGVLVQLATSMRVHARGGTLLVVHSNSEEWRESIVTPVSYSVSPPFRRLAELLRDEPAEHGRRRWEEALRRAVDAVAGLTAVDGATVLNDRYEVLAFGAKIRRREGWAQVEQVILTEPIEGTEPRTLSPPQLGGTRHLSAAQFGHDQRDAVALVASQDGRFTVFAWSECEQMVHAQRVETLLL